MKGKIVSTKMNKTAVVAVSRYFRHPKYKKYISRSKKYKADNEENKYKEGEKVLIESCRPLSKDKHFKIIGYA